MDYNSIYKFSFSEEDTIAYIIIDGYNLIGIHHGSLDYQRKNLVKKLIEYRKIRAHDITIVFDGHGGSSSKETVRVEGGVRIIYSRIARKADDVIKDLLKRERRYFIVVSSDREVSDFAWSCGSVPVSSEDFHPKLEKALNRRLPIQSGEGRDKEIPSHKEGIMNDIVEKMLIDELEANDLLKKGSAYRLSKRQRAIKRALNKL